MHIKFFNDLNFRDAKIAGGKGASLGEMTRAGIPVPPGFVVLASAFEDFIAENDLNVEINAQLKKVNIKKISTVEKVSKFLRSIIIRQKISKETEKQILSAFDKLKAKYVAVRSSATAEDSKVAAWAGQLETYLGIEKNKF